MPGDVASNTQTQSQQQTITISVESAGDPELESRIFSQVHSAGRQLGALSAVVTLLLAAHESDPSFAASNEARAAIDAFKQIQLDILRAKSLQDPDRLVDQLDALRRTDPTAFTSVRDRLNAWLKDK